MMHEANDVYRTEVIAPIVELLYVRFYVPWSRPSYGGNMGLFIKFRDVLKTGAATQYLSLYPKRFHNERPGYTRMYGSLDKLNITTNTIRIQECTSDYELKGKETLSS